MPLLFKTNLALYNKHVHVLFVNMFKILMSQTINIDFENDCIFGILILLNKTRMMVFFLSKAFLNNERSFG